MSADSAAFASDVAPATPGGSDYARLSRAVRQAGLMDARSGNYAWRIAITIFFLAAGWGVFVLAGNSWWQLALAVFLAVMFTQVGFLGHDAGHRQICASRRLRPSLPTTRACQSCAVKTSMTSCAGRC